LAWIEKFYILENENERMVILGNPTVKWIEEIIKQNKKEMLVKCRIDTKQNDIVSWNRPIRVTKTRLTLRYYVKIYLNER
jgi:site-specific recombinase XerD